MYSNKLNLDEFFFAVRNQEYVIIKITEEFPNYYKGSDVDVFCADLNKFSVAIFHIGNNYINSSNCRIEVANIEENNHTHIDFFFDDDLDFRFDLYSSMPKFNTIKMKKYYFYSVIDRKVSFFREYNKRKYPAYIPSPVDGLILRYLEYLDWYEKRPDKIKHLDYILDRISEEKLKNNFLDRLHLYAEFPHNKNKDYHMRSYIMSRYFSLPLYYIKKIKSKGMFGILKTIKKIIDKYIIAFIKIKMRLR